MLLGPNTTRNKRYPNNGTLQSLYECAMTQVATHPDMILIIGRPQSLNKRHIIVQYEAMEGLCFQIRVGLLMGIHMLGTACGSLQ